MSGEPGRLAWNGKRAESKNGKKIMAKKKKMALGLTWGKNGPEMAQKWDLGSFFHLFCHWGPSAIFYFLASFFQFYFGPFSTLYLVAPCG